MSISAFNACTIRGFLLILFYVMKAKGIVNDMAGTLANSKEESEKCFKVCYSLFILLSLSAIILKLSAHSVFSYRHV